MAHHEDLFRGEETSKTGSKTESPCPLQPQKDQEAGLLLKRMTRLVRSVSRADLLHADWTIDPATEGHDNNNNVILWPGTK